MMTAVTINNNDQKVLLYPIILKLQFEHSNTELTNLIRLELGRKSTHKDIFYIKSEIVRLAKPCARLIDLRTFATNLMFDNFQWEGMDHILDKDSAQEFLRLLRLYQGEYTFGVYEGVLNYFKSSKQKIKEQQFGSSLEIDTVSLSECFSRNEERMNLGVKLSAIPISVSSDELEDILPQIDRFITKDIFDNKIKPTIAGKTVDISLSGLQAKITGEIDVGSYIAIRFNGFEGDFFFNQKYVAYQVLSVGEIDANKLYPVALRQLNLESHQEFKLFSKRLIFANKKRYKVSLENTWNSVRSKLYEQFYLSRRRALDVFVTKQGVAEYILASDPALEMVTWFSNKSKEYLSELLFKDRIPLALKEKAEVYWLVFKKKSPDSDKLFGFYSTIISDVLSYKFAAYAIKSGKGKIFKVTSNVCVPSKGFITSSLPRSVHKEMGDDAIYRYSPKLTAIVDNFDHIITIKEVSNGAMDILDVDSINITKDELKECSKYFLKNHPYTVAEVLRLESNEFRREDRFSVITPVTLEFRGEVLCGSTIDVSTKGLAIKMERDIEIPKGTEILVTLDVLKEKENEFDLVKIPYKSISVKDGLLRIEAMQERGFVGIKFWNKYISDNIDKLTIVGATEPHYGLKRVLRNLAAHSHDSVPAYFTVKDSRPCVRTIGLSVKQESHPIWGSIRGSFSIETQLKPLFYHKAMFKRLVLDLPSISRGKPFSNYFLLVAYSQNLSSKIEISKVQFLPQTEVLSTMKKSIHNIDGEYRIFNVSLTKKSRLFDRYFRDEMRYLETYSSHKAKRLMFDIKTLTGVLDFVDVTLFFKDLITKV